MKRNDLREKWIGVAVAVAFGAMGWLYLRPDASPTHVASQDVDQDKGLEQPLTSSDPAEVGAGLKRRPLPAPRRNMARTGRPSESRPDRPTPSERMHPVMKRALDEHPELSQYHWLAQKVLPTVEHRRMLEEMLSDLELIEKAKLDLLASSETDYSREEEAKRMLQVEFLSDAIAWKENPEMAAIVEAIEDVLLADNISADMPDDLAQSLAGDKMDLYTQVLHSSPDHAATIAEHASGKPVDPLLTYSKDWLDSERLAMQANETP